MARDDLTYVWTTTGSKALSLGFQPKVVRFTVSKKNTTNDYVAHICHGIAIDGTSGVWQECEAIYSDTTGAQSWRFDDRVISHWERVSGTLTEVLKVTLTNFNSTGITVNVVNAANYIVNLEFET